MYICQNFVYDGGNVEDMLEVDNLSELILHVAERDQKTKRMQRRQNSAQLRCGS